MSFTGVLMRYTPAAISWTFVPAWEFVIVIGKS